MKCHTHGRGKSYEILQWWIDDGVDYTIRTQTARDLLVWALRLGRRLVSSVQMRFAIQPNFAFSFCMCMRRLGVDLLLTCVRFLSAQDYTAFYRRLVVLSIRSTLFTLSGLWPRHGGLVCRPADVRLFSVFTCGSQLVNASIHNGWYGVGRSVVSWRKSIVLWSLASMLVLQGINRRCVMRYCVVT